MPWLLGAVVVVITFLAYWNSLNGEFQFDDIPNIVQNPHVHMTEITGESLRDVARSPNRRRYLSNLSLALNFYAGRYNVLGYHLVNTLIHAVNGILAMLLGGMLLRRLYPDLDGTSRQLVAGAAALVFVLHPVQVQSVTYIVQRMNSMAALFSFTTVACYLRGRDTTGRARIAWWGTAGASIFAGFLSKENTFILPLVLLVIEWWLRAREDRSRGTALRVATAGIILAGATVAWNMLPGIMDGYRIRDFTMTERLLTQPRVVFHYLSLLIWPLPGRFHLDYDFLTSTSLVSPPATLAAIAGLAATLACGWWTRRRAPLIAFAVFWYFGNLVVESTIVPLEMVFEHRVYLPSFGIFLALAYYGYRACRGRLVIFLPAVAVLVVVLVAATVQRNEAWKTQVSLMADSAEKAATKARIHNNRGWGHLERGELKEAEAAFLKAIEVNTEPDYSPPYANLGAVYIKQKRFQEAFTALTTAVRMNPGDRDAMINLGVAAMMLKNLDRADGIFSSLIRANPDYYLPYLKRGMVAFERGDRAAARRDYQAALSRERGVAEVYARLAELAYVEGRFPDAAERYEEALRIEPDNTSLRLMRGKSLLGAGRRDEAVREIEQALAIDPALPGANLLLGNLFAEAGDLDRAERYFLRETTVSGDTAAFNNLGNVNVLKGRTAQARDYYRKALEADPNNTQARMNLRRLGGRSAQ